MSRQSDKKICVNCHRPLLKRKGAWVCLKCNPETIDLANIFEDDINTDEYVFIECPGATLYDPETNEIVEGVRWLDEDDASKGYEVIGHQIFAPNHKHHRRIKRNSLGKIRRCRACQDYTIRMRRPEGRDFFIPSPKHPRRTKLKPMSHVTAKP